MTYEDLKRPLSFDLKINTIDNLSKIDLISSKGKEI